MKKLRLITCMIVSFISCNKEINDPEITLKIEGLACQNTNFVGSLIAEQEILEDVYFSIPYSSSSGGSLPELKLTSTEVDGITATLSEGLINQNGGFLKFVLSGKPSKEGSAIFFISLANTSCTVSLDVSIALGSIRELDCTNSKDTSGILNNIAFRGINVTYSGGNGSDFDGQTIPSIGVKGLTATLQPGKFSNGSGKLFFNITGIPDGGGFASFPLNIGGIRCTLTREVIFPLVQSELGMKYIPGGTFPMGCNSGEKSCYNNLPVRSITLSDFEIGEAEVTESQFKIIRSNLLRGDSFPVVEVSWFQAVEFCNRLSIAKGLKPCYYADSALSIFYGNSLGSFPLPDGGNVYLDQSAKGYRLPTEAEWEYAARGGQNDHIYSGGNVVEEVAWYIGNSGNSLNPIKRKSPNGYGLYDMSGNAHEWCYDWYSDDYPAQPQINPIGPARDATITSKVIRGGDFHVEAIDCRVFSRIGWTPSMYSFYINPSAKPLWQHGFRIARSI